MPVASATTIDFSTLPLYTPVTTQFPGVVFSLMGGPADPTQPPVTGSFGSPSLGNSPTGEYPTTNILDIAFSSPVSNLSFTFDNFGDNNGFGAPSYFYAYDGSSGLISSGNIGSVNGFPSVAVTGSGIRDLQISNGSGGSYDWEFGVGSITYAAAPEPATWILLMSGFGGIAALGYLQRRRPAARTA
jgi:hypothetical protein